jgi:hypothetical protein
MSTAESANTAPVSRGSMCRLAVYGTLAPGRPNHHQLNSLSGRWIKGTVRGQLLQEGWGAELGYPGIVLDLDGPPSAFSSSNHQILRITGPDWTSSKDRPTGAQSRQ